jgi:hypothetical protein
MARSVVQVCQDSQDHPELLKGCNLFVIAVAKAFGYGDAVIGNADAILEKFSSVSSTFPPFIHIGKNPVQATKMAEEGHLVIGGLTKTAMTYIGREIASDDVFFLNAATCKSTGRPVRLGVSVSDAVLEKKLWRHGLCSTSRQSEQQDGRPQDELLESAAAVKEH